MITKELAGAALQQLAAAHERIAAAMYTVDTHPAWSRLATVTGLTQSRGVELRAEVDRLWESFAALREQLERAPRLPLAELDGLLTTLQELAEQTEQRCATVLTGLSLMDTAWTAVVGEYLTASAELDDLASLAASVGAVELADPARAVAVEVERLDLPDPLASAPDGRLAPATRARLHELRSLVAQAGRDVSAAVVARDTYAERRRALAELVDGVEAAEKRTTATYVRVVERIARPGLAPAPDSVAVLRARLADLDELGAAQRWRRLADGLSAVDAAAREALARADELTELASGLLARRDELRGRLEAFRAKAAARGLVEDPALTPLYTAAHDLLFTAPCDLRAATRAVQAYASGIQRSPDE